MAKKSFKKKVVYIPNSEMNESRWWGSESGGKEAKRKQKKENEKFRKNR